MSGRIISFYSYKGGVGRSMALANVAVLLAQRGRRVLAVDFDLDAPGLHRYFLRDDTPLGAQRRQPRAGQYGVIDLFREMLACTLEEEAPLDAAIVRRLLGAGGYGYRVRVADPAAGTSCALGLLTAGKLHEEYTQYVRDFPWVAFYEARPAIFKELAQQWRELHDDVLIDSRSGLTDIGNVSTTILADKLVLAFVPNEQSLSGALDVGRQAVELKRSLGGDLQLFPLLSRVDEGEADLRRTHLLDAARRFERLFVQLYGACDVDFAAYFDAVHIPHSSEYAYGERIAAEEKTTAAFGSISAGYARFVDALRGDRLAGWKERAVDPLGPRPRGCALLASLETRIEPPSSLVFGSIVRVPEQLAPDTSARLRTVPIDPEAWTQALAEIDRGVARAATETAGDLHVFAMMPYPAAVHLGVRLDQMARGRPLRMYQVDPETHDWVPLWSPEASPQAEPPPHFDVQHLRGATGDAAVLALEGTRPIEDEPLRVLAARAGAATIHRLRPRAPTPFRSAGELRSAVAALRRVLLEIRAPALHIVATAPVVLLVELGRLLAPAGRQSAIVYQFDQRTQAHVPTLDVVSGQVLSTASP